MYKRSLSDFWWCDVDVFEWSYVFLYVSVMAMMLQSSGAAFNGCVFLVFYSVITAILLMYYLAKSGPVTVRPWEPCMYARGFVRQDFNGVPEVVMMTDAGHRDRITFRWH